MNILETYTHRLEECRRRWNTRTLDYVVESGSILAQARASAKDAGRWLEWLKQGPRMDRSTALRHIRVSEYVYGHVALKQHLATLSLSKVYALTRIEPDLAGTLARDPRLPAMSDRQFSRFIRKHLPERARRQSMRFPIRSVVNRLRAVHEAIGRLVQRHRNLSQETVDQILQEAREVHKAALQLRGPASRAS